MVTHSPLISEIYSSNPGSYIGKLAYGKLTDSRQFSVQNLDNLYVLVSSPIKLPVKIRPMQCRK